MLKRFALAALFYSPIYLGSTAVLYVLKPDPLPTWAYILLPLVPLFIFFWWIMHRDEGL